VIGHLFEVLEPRIVILFKVGLLLAMFQVMVMLYRSTPGSQS